MYYSTLLALVSVTFAAPLAPVKRDDIIVGKYIVKLKGDITTSTDDELKASISTSPDFEYSLPGFRGFAGTLTNEELAQLQGSDQVEYVEPNAKVYASAIVEQANATWGLARISHATANITTYLYDETAGEGTCAYVIDTGIDISHPEFGGRATFLTDTSGENLLEDGNGHGTHVAGTIGSATWGVAKKTKLFAVKVLDSSGSGTTAGVIAGIQYVNDDAQQRSEECPNGIVSNMSLGGRISAPINEASAGLVSSGVFLAVAAGNAASNAINYSPASEPTVCTVGATTISDTFAPWSNYGPRVDILAPGNDITSTWPGNDTNTISGTSMASPHIAGLAAYLLGLGHVEVGGLCEVIAGIATKGAIDPATLPSGTPNLLAFNRAEDGKRVY